MACEAIGVTTQTLQSDVEALGLTFDNVLAELQPRRHDIPRLRLAYGQTLRGPADAAPFFAKHHPVIRHVRDGGLIKFVQRLPDGLETESVIIPMAGYHRSWNTLCISSQVGCAMGCTFCETAQLGLLKSLPAKDIVGQVVAARRVFGAEIRNIVFMGMGEPFDNFEAVIQAVRVLCDPSGLSFAKAHVSISTVGRTEGIRKLAELNWRRINLAVSLNAPNDEIRSRIMPINRREPMAALRDAMAAYPLRKCQFIMIEYVLIPGVNDAYAHAIELAEYLRPLKCCVNVIPYNPRLHSPWPAPTEESVRGFIDWLNGAGQFTKRRVTKGRGYMAACGQLGNRDFSRRQRPLDASEPPMSAQALPVLR